MNRTEVLTIPLDIISKSEILSLVKEWVKGKDCKVINTPNPEMCVEAQSNSDFRAAFLNADLNITDGTGLVWAAKKLHDIKLHRWPGIDAMVEFCALAQEQGWQVYLLGGKGKSAKQAANELNKKFPTLKINVSLLEPVVKNDGTISDYESNMIMEDIARHQPKLIFVGFGAPKQELWLFKNKQKLTDRGIKVGMGVGGSFDYICGISKRPPKFISSMGIEWLWRLILEPWRWRRIMKAIIVFPRYVYLWQKRIKLPLRKGVTLVIQNKSKQILTLHCIQKGQNGSSSWGLPGGGVDLLETDEQAALREAAEETGLKNLTIIKWGPVYEYLWPLTWFREDCKGQAKRICYLKYKGEADPVISEKEIFNEYKWVEPKELINEIHLINTQLAKLVIANLTK